MASRSRFPNHEPRASALVAMLVAGAGTLTGCGADDAPGRAGGQDRRQDVKLGLEDLSSCGPTNVALNAAATGLPSPLESDPAIANPWALVDGQHEYVDPMMGLALPVGGAHQVTVDLGRPVTFDELVVWHHSDNGVPGHSVPGDVTLEYHDGSAWQPLSVAARSYDLGYPQPDPGFGSYPDTYAFAPTSGSRLRWSYDGDGQNVLGPGDEVVGDAVSVSAGEKYTCAVRESGEVACWGSGWVGQLGNGSFADSKPAVTVAGLADAVSVSAGREHACALRATGEVACWGAGWAGQLGDGTFYTSEPPGLALPVAVSGLSDAVGISAGDEFTCAVRETGQAACWGRGHLGQLGNAGAADSSTPIPVPGLADVLGVSAGDLHACALRATGEVACWGTGYLGNATGPEASTREPPTLVPGIADAVGVAAGRGSACVVRGTGAALCWGFGLNLGSGTGVTSETPVPVVGLADVASISASGQYYGQGPTCAVRATGAVACWGAGLFGQLGNGDTFDTYLPVPVSSLGDATAVAAGYDHVCALRAGGEVVCWGQAFDGEFSGDPIVPFSSSPVAVSDLDDALEVDAGGVYACAVRETGGVSCWGYTPVLSGNPGMPSSSTSPEPVSMPSDALRIAVGDWHVCAVLDTGRVACWGDGREGQLGNGSFGASTTPVLASSLLSDATLVAAGSGHTCALRSTGGVACWGRGERGALGNGSTANSPDPVAVSGLGDAVALAAGMGHTCAVRDTGLVACWGRGSEGQLGDGSASHSTTPVLVSGIGDAIGVAAGQLHTCALRAGGAVACWGSGGAGQLGDGSASNAPTPVSVSGLDDAVAVAAGGNHTCALRETGEVVCWGYNVRGQLGDGAVVDGYSELVSSTPVSVLDLDDAVGITAAGSSSCALRATGELACWGDNSTGQLGIGAAGYSSTPLAAPGVAATDSWHAWIYEVTVNGCVEPVLPESAAEIVPAGATLSTDAEGDGATLADPVETGVTTPGGGAVSIEEAPFGGGPPDGFVFFGQQVVISAPSASVLSPLVITFTIDGSLLPAGTDAGDVEIFRDGVLVAACALPAPPRAVPNPCVFSRALQGDDVVITVATSAASTWSFGVALPSDRDGDGTLDGYDECPDDPDDGCNDPEPVDSDDDGVDDDADRCPATPAGDVVGAGGCSIAQLCPCSGPRGPGRRWRHHRDYVACVGDAAGSLRAAGIISRSELRGILREAERSRCGTGRPGAPRRRPRR